MKVYIQAVQERMPYVREWMVPALNRAELTDITFMVDHDRNGCHWNSVRIWEAITADDATALVLQDDVILHARFGSLFAQVMNHFTAQGMSAMSLFAPPRAAMDSAFKAGFNFAENYNFLWMPAIVLSAAFTRGLLEANAKLSAKEHGGHDDVVVQWHVKQSGTPVWTTLPSLIQHDISVKSSLGHPPKVGKTLRISRLWQSIPDDHFAKVNSKVIR